MQALLTVARRSTIVVTLGALALTGTGTGAVAQDAGDGSGAEATATSAEAAPDQFAATVPFQLAEDRQLDDRLPQPEDRYALASGCYAVEAPGVGWLTRDGGAVGVSDDAAAAEPFHFRAARLGDYLIAANDGPNTEFEGAWWDDRSYLSSENSPVPDLVTLSNGVQFVDEPSELAEWTIVAAGDDPDARHADGQEYLAYSSGFGLYVQTDGLGLAADGIEATPLRFHHVDDAEACPTWPEVSTNTTGLPQPTGGGAADEVRGLMESHIHGMAFEFLGGEARCGRPWHPYGVEYALVDCEDHGPGGYTAILEVAVSGADPFGGHDTVGWPTFGYWPQHDSLTHEQVYYKWLERAWLGGLRMYVNLLVENQVLCEVFPVKRNSCNEMDSVRLQAQRIFEFQDYIDAQWGGPGEGWFRIVTTPAQARQVINDGRVAVILGIEISTLFDCGEYLDQPLCTQDDIDARLQEAYDMGVRQMELLNKFDSGLAGVTGDGGTTGALVNQANKRITGHWWDMETCVEEEDHPFHQHDKTQLNAEDDIPDDGNGGFDTLAGTIMDAFGGTGGILAPAYPAAPHCNTRGLTDLGRYLISAMAERGMMIDPDHMSAKAQAEMMAYIQEVVIPAEIEQAAAEGRAPIQPALLSSHSWANDVIYRKIYELGGFIGPRTADAGRFADYWAERKAWFDELAPASSVFGLGYGADTNGFGGQPGPRGEAAKPLTYDQPWEAPVGGVLIHQQVSGLRTYDINTDGVAHYGLFADWFRELQLAADERYPELGGGDALMADMLKAPEAYLQMWERAVYGGNECVTDQSMPQVEDLHAALGGNFEGFMQAVGRPASRDGAAYVYCAQAEDGSIEVLDVVFDAAGQATLVRSSASGLQPQEPAPAAVADESADHGHDPSPLPATGGGSLRLALLVLGLAALLSELLRGRLATR